MEPIVKQIPVPLFPCFCRQTNTGLGDSRTLREQVFPDRWLLLVTTTPAD